jgi:hypothetical protein
MCGKMSNLMLELQEQNPDNDDYDYLYNEWLKQFEPDKKSKIKIKKFKADKNGNRKESINRSK